MKIKQGETIESWASRVEMYEKGKALQRIANGDDPVAVMEDMSRGITSKLLHPILTAIRESVPDNFDVDENRREYEEVMKNIEKPADHVDADT